MNIHFEIVGSCILVLITIQIIYFINIKIIKNIIKKEGDELEKTLETNKQLMIICCWITILIFTLISIWNPFKH